MARSIRHQIPGQLASYINEDYPQFVEFLSSYYEWLETEGSPYHNLRNHLSYLDFKESLETYTKLLKSEYLHSVPEKVVADKELLIRYSKQFFQTLGTEASFKFVFKILYGEEVELYYPKDDILRPSDGVWIANENLMYVSNSGNVESFLYRRIKQTREPYPGIFEYAYATVNRITNRYAKKFNFSELYVTDIEGEFDINYPIEVEGREEWIMPICGDVEVVDAGMNYSTDNRLTYTGDATFDVVFNATESGTVNGRYTTILDVSELSVRRNGELLTAFTYDGQYFSHPDIRVGDEIAITYPVYEGLVVVDRTATMGSLDSFNVVDTPFGIMTPQTIEGLEGGSGGVAVLKPALTRQIPGYFFSTNGFLSSDKKIQDSDYYQDYSYVIRAGIDIDRYKDVVMRLLHPAGMKMIGEVNIVELIRLIMTDLEFRVDIKAIGDTAIESYVDLYSRYGVVDDMKINFDAELYKTFHFKDMVVEDVVVNYMKRFNCHDMKVGIVDTQYIVDYVEPGYVQP